MNHAAFEQKYMKRSTLRASIVLFVVCRISRLHSDRERVKKNVFCNYFYLKHHGATACCTILSQTRYYTIGAFQPTGMNDSNSADERARFEEVLQRKVNSYLDCGDAAGADFESSCSGEDFGSMPGTPRTPDEKRCQVVEDILERMEIPFDQRQRLPWRCLLQDLEVEEIFTPRREGAKYCAVCYKWMNGERQWYEHVHGKSHKKKTGKSTSKQVTVPKKPPGSPDAQGSVVGFDNANAPDSMTSTPLEEKNGTLHKNTQHESNNSNANWDQQGDHCRWEPHYNVWEPRLTWTRVDQKKDIVPKNADMTSDTEDCTPHTNCEDQESHNDWENHHWQLHHSEAYFANTDWESKCTWNPTFVVCHQPGHVSMPWVPHTWSQHPIDDWLQAAWTPQCQ